MQQAKIEGATPWLERPKQARRYEPRQFPFMNLGRIYLKQGRWWEALHQFEAAVRLAPADAELAKTLHSLRGRLNCRGTKPSPAPGRPYPLGAVWAGSGVSFALFSEASLSGGRV